MLQIMSTLLTFVIIESTCLNIPPKMSIFKKNGELLKQISFKEHLTSSNMPINFKCVTISDENLIPYYVQCFLISYAGEHYFKIKQTNVSLTSIGILNIELRYFTYR